MNYNRKYYLHRCVRSAGLGLTIGKESKTISVKPDQTPIAHNNKYVKELRDVHSYAIQYINPIMNL